MFANHCDAFNCDGADVCNKKYQQLLDFISGAKDNISRLDLEARKETYYKCVEKLWKIMKKLEQNNCGPDILAEMDRGLKKYNIVKKIR